MNCYLTEGLLQRFNIKLIIFLLKLTIFLIKFFILGKFICNKHITNYNFYKPKLLKNFKKKNHCTYMKTATLVPISLWLRVQV